MLPFIPKGSLELLLLCYTSSKKSDWSTLNEIDGFFFTKPAIIIITIVLDSREGSHGLLRGVCCIHMPV